LTHARELFKSGRLDDAIEALGAEVRDNPTDAQRRAFLFELLCFAGNYDRAEKQLSVIGRGGRDAEMGALLYHAALHAERLRQDMFDKQAFPSSTAQLVGGTLNGTPFTTIEDADPRIGARLELFAAGQYSWMPFEHIATIRAEPPKRLRDLLWLPAIVRPGETFTGLEMGEVLLPVVAAQSWQYDEGDIRLGRVTEWTKLDDGAHVPIGQKLLLVDGEEFPMLELRELEIVRAPAALA
jgi:type VI secretion system protein ImpE